MHFSVPATRSQSTGRFLSTVSRTVLTGALGFALVFTVGAVPVNAQEPDTPAATEQAVLPADEELPVDGQSPDPVADQETTPTAEPDASQEISPSADPTEEQPTGTPSPDAEQTADTDATPTPQTIPDPAPSAKLTPAAESPSPSSPPATPETSAIPSEQPAEATQEATEPTEATQEATEPTEAPSPAATPEAVPEPVQGDGPDIQTPGAYMGQGLAMEEAAAATNTPLTARTVSLASNTPMMARTVSLAASTPSIPAGTPGMDVSGWQADSGYTRSTVNWAGEWSKGSRFVYVKATEGSSFIDKSRTSHLAGASKVGMLHGAYHFALPGHSTASAQADHFVKNGGTWKADGKTLPPLLDIENNPYGDKCYNLSPSAMVTWIKTFSNRVQARTGRLPMIYTNYYWWLDCTGNSKAFTHQPLHIAAYTGGSIPWKPGGWKTYSMWQFSSTGPFAGDSNVWNGTLASLKKFATGTTVSRINGKDRYEVSAAVSKSTFPAGTKTAYIASGAVYTDALSGSAAAGHNNSPVLLTATNVLPYVIRAELTRLNPQRIVILGGPGTVSNSVMTLLKRYSPSVSRISGKDRYVVSAGVSKSTFPVGTKTAYIASGAIYTDALSGSAAAGHSGSPILLTAPNVLPYVIRAELSRLKPQRIVILGGTGTVSNSVMTLLKSYSPSVTRISGKDRYEVSAGVSKANYRVGTNTVYIASGAVYSDALSGSAAAARKGSPVLLTAPNVLPNSIRAELQRLKPARIVILGGTGSVSNGVLWALQNYAG